MNSNKLFVNQSADDLTFLPVPEENSLIFEIKNFTIQFRSDKFSYSLLTVPIRGFLDAYLSETLFRVKVQFGTNTTKEGRILPTLNVTECVFTLSPSKIKFDLGGNILLHMLDVILPIL